MNGIRLSLVQFTNINLNVSSFDIAVTEELNADHFSVRCLHNDHDSKAFGIFFEIHLTNPKKEFNLLLHATAHFETDTPYDKQFLNSDFVKINAPAIAFPYIRSFISNLTLNSGYRPVILPTYNFIEMNRIKEQQEKSQRQAKKTPKSKKVKTN